MDFNDYHNNYHDTGESDLNDDINIYNYTNEYDNTFFAPYTLLVFIVIGCSNTFYQLCKVIVRDRRDKHKITQLTKTIKKNDLDNSKEVKSRESAIRGFFPFMESMNFCLNSDMKLDLTKIGDLPTQNCCIMGFTWLLYTIILENEKNNSVKDFFKKINNPVIIHIGGWKKLSDKKVSKEEFNQGWKPKKK